ncbi:hypothetical protein VCHENC02_4464B, partial [Vibrio harveyi]
ETTTTN